MPDKGQSDWALGLFVTQSLETENFFRDSPYGWVWERFFIIQGVSCRRFCSDVVRRPKGRLRGGWFFRFFGYFLYFPGCYLYLRRRELRSTKRTSSPSVRDGLPCFADLMPDEFIWFRRRIGLVAADTRGGADNSCMAPKERKGQRSRSQKSQPGFIERERSKTRWKVIVGGRKARRRGATEFRDGLGRRKTIRSWKFAFLFRQTVRDGTAASRRVKETKMKCTIRWGVAPYSSLRIDVFFFSRGKLQL